MKDTKKILLIGRSGRGKSTLANVITGLENKFKESGSSASETKKIQFEKFEDKETDYLIIDTPGIGDTKMSDNEVLDIIAEAVYLVKDGLSQVLFVVGGRFDQSEMATYNLLRTIIFDKDITQHTTITRTRFGEFRDKDECKADIDSMVKEAKDKKTELESDIAKKEEELENLSSNSIEHQKLLKEVEQLKRELVATNLAEIIESCQGKVVHVDNPPIEVAGADEDELRLNKRKRDRSRKITLEHLKNNCQKDPYKPEKLKELSEAIVKDMDKLLKSRKELEAEMTKLKTQGSKNNNQSPGVASSENKSRSENISLEDNKEESPIEVIEKEEQPTEELESNSGIIAIGKIKELEDKKDKLRKEIADKEKVIRQKVLKHIFNNIDNISNELGGNVFLDSVVGEHKWENISPEFTSKELVVKWLGQKFDYEQVQKWAKALENSFKPKDDAGFCAWLRDDKKLTVESKELLAQVSNIEQLREEYAHQLEKENEILDKHNQQLGQGEEEQELSQAQQWLDEWYPKEERKDVTRLVIDNEGIEGSLKLEKFTNLKELEILNNRELTDLDLSDLPSEKLTRICVYNNNLTERNLSMFSRFINCEVLSAGNTKRVNPGENYDKFFGSLEHLKDLSKLRHVGVNNSNVDSGLEYLPSGVEEYYFYNDGGVNSLTSGVDKLTEILKPYGGDYQAWRKDNADLIKEASKSPAQQRLDEDYPKSYRGEITSLDIYDINSNGELKLEGFDKVTYINCNNHSIDDYNHNPTYLSSLDITECGNLQVLYADAHQFTAFDFSQNLQLKELSIASNNFFEQGLSFLSHLVNLEQLDVSNRHKRNIDMGIYNRFTGSLEPLKYLTKLKRLNIQGANINTGLEYLPDSIENFDCSVGERPESKVREIEQELRKFGEPDGNNYALLLRKWKEYRLEQELTKSPAQKWLDENYPKDKRINITDLDISDQNLEGSLKLEGFSNLEVLNCESNKLTGLDLSECSKIKQISCCNNKLTNIKLSETNDLNDLEHLDARENYLTDINFLLLPNLDPENLKTLRLGDNNFSPSDLKPFSRFVNLEWLSVFGNYRRQNYDEGIASRLYGSLEPLQFFTKLETLEIENTDIDSGLEYLPENLKTFYCNAEEGRRILGTKVRKIYEQLREYGTDGHYNLQAWRKDNADLITEEKSPAQQWLDEWYPKNGVSKHEKDYDDYYKWVDGRNREGWNNKNKKREEVKKLDLYSSSIDYRLEGSLKLEGFSNLEEFIVPYNELTDLDLSDCYNLVHLGVFQNKLTNLDFLNPKSKKGLPNPEKLKWLNIYSNTHLPHQNLDFLTPFTGLTWICMSSCNLNGSLKPLQNMTNLDSLNICKNKGVDSGLEYLPDSLEEFEYQGNKLEEELDSYNGSAIEKLQAWRLANKNQRSQAQQWLDENYPKEERENITKLEIGLHEGLEGHLDLTDFVNLEKLMCDGSPDGTCRNDMGKLTSLNVSNLTKLKYINLSGNKLTSIKTNSLDNLEELIVGRNYLTDINGLMSGLNPKKLKNLSLGDNNFSESDLTPFSKFINLERLQIFSKWYRQEKGIHNRFYGSLEPLKNLNKLGFLDIENTDISSGLEHLPNSLKSIGYSNDQKPDAKVSKIREQLAPYNGNVQVWKKTNQELLEKVKNSVEIQLPLKDIPSEYWDKVEVGNDWDSEYAMPLPNTVKLPIMVDRAISHGYDKRFKSQELLKNFKKYTDGEDDFYGWAGVNIRPKIKDIPADCFGDIGNDEKDWNKWHSVSYFSTEKKLTQYLRDANKLFVKDGYGKVTSQEAFEFLQSITESQKIKATVKLTQEELEKFKQENQQLQAQIEVDPNQK